MGYSYAAKAGYALSAMLEILQAVGNQNNTSNGWTFGKNSYFYERGREQQDGSITGAVYRMDGHKVGTVKIDANGVVKRFPTARESQRDLATQQGLAKYRSLYETCHA